MLINVEVCDMHSLNCDHHLRTIALKHFGLQRTLPELTDLEQRLIATIRSNVNTVKLVAVKAGDGCQWAIKGHTISIPHEGPEMCAKRSGCSFVTVG